MRIATDGRSLPSPKPVYRVQNNAGYGRACGVTWDIILRNNTPSPNFNGDWNFRFWLQQTVHIGPIPVEYIPVLISPLSVLLVFLSLPIDYKARSTALRTTGVDFDHNEIS